jgi:hypothetical protein
LQLFTVAPRFVGSLPKVSLPGIYGESLYPIVTAFSGIAPYPPNFRVTDLAGV